MLSFDMSMEGGPTISWFTRSRRVLAGGCGREVWAADDSSWSTTCQHRTSTLEFRLSHVVSDLILPDYRDLFLFFSSTSRKEERAAVQQELHLRDIKAGTDGGILTFPEV